MENNEVNLATELLHELKANAKRWFIAFCIMVVLELLTIGGFMWYISLPVEEGSTTQTAEDIEDGVVTQIGGNSYGEDNTEENLQEKGYEK